MPSRSATIYLDKYSWYLIDAAKEKKRKNQAK
jgi:hypothetical protein